MHYLAIFVTSTNPVLYITALRIHMSNMTTDLLRLSEDFIIELRGDIEVKGKGLMTTYWLTGKQGFDLPLLSLSLAAPMEDHYFK